MKNVAKGWQKKLKKIKILSQMQEKSKKMSKKTEKMSKKQKNGQKVV